jgi:hypothetical protein
MTDDPRSATEPGTTAITDEYMGMMLGRARPYSLVLLRATPAYDRPEVDAIIWEHGRRNFALRSEGLLAIVCPVADDTDLCGIGVFTSTVEETARIMDGDPGVRAGIFAYEVHPVRSLPGDSLPEAAPSSSPA